MDARLQLRVQRYGWDAAASHYHSGWEAQLRPAHDQLLSVAEIAPGQRIIETACGSGLVTLRLAAMVGPQGRILATDLSQGMLDDLRARLDAGSVETIEVSRMPAEELDVPDATYDTALCALGLMYTPDPDRAVAEMARVVAPGGTVAATVWGERRNCGWAEVFPIVDARVASEVCPMFFGTGAPGALRRAFEEFRARLSASTDPEDDHGRAIDDPRPKPKTRPERPRLYKVILLNDDFTPREFVVKVLKAVFRMDRSEAYTVMLAAHQQGACVVAVLPLRLRRKRPEWPRTWARGKAIRCISPPNGRSDPAATP
jgi:ATP-dependent Clp protease adapter protein ClpS/protein-L-isoaspartate O-methyltransferase